MRGGRRPAALRAPPAGAVPVVRGPDPGDNPRALAGARARGQGPGAIPARGEGGMHKRLATAALACILLAAVGTAAAERTTGAYPACGKPFWLEAMLAFRAEGRTEAYERWINHGRCIELRAGLEVEVVRYYGDAAHPRVELELNGYRFFTVRAAVAQPL